MTRPVTARMAEALASGNPRVLFVSIDHPDGTAYFWSGIGTRTWNGQTWIGTGVLGTVSPIKQSSDISIQDIQFTLSGIDPTILAELNDSVYNRSGQAWMACLDEQDNVVPDPYLIVDSILDFQTITIGTANVANASGDQSMTATITITAHTGFYTLDRAIDEAWTPENQHFLFPDDTGLDMIPELQNQNLQWTPT